MSDSRGVRWGADAGLKQFDIDQAAFLAKCGYVGLAVDLYREHDIVGADPELTYAFEDRDPKRDLAGYGTTIKGQVSEAQKARALRHGAGSSGCMMGLLRNPKHFRALMAAWLDHARTHPAVHPEYAGSIGYCLGGQSLLEQVRDGQNVQAVCSFHGLLHSRPVMPGRADPRGGFFDRFTAEEFEADPEIENAENNHNTACKVLIENGDLDEHVPTESMDEFRDEMDAVGIDWRINNHARTPHGFALAPGMWGTMCKCSRSLCVFFRRSSKQRLHRPRGRRPQVDPLHAPALRRGLAGVPAVSCGYERVRHEPRAGSCQCGQAVNAELFASACFTTDRAPRAPTNSLASPPSSGGSSSTAEHRASPRCRGIAAPANNEASPQCRC